MERKPNNPISIIRELVTRYNQAELAACIQTQLVGGNNQCITDQDTVSVMAVLAKAEFVRNQMEEGQSTGQALRELGRRIRAVGQAE